MLSQPERDPCRGWPARFLRSSVITLLTVTLGLCLSACSGGGGGGSDPGSDAGDLEVGSLWPQKDSTPPGEFGTDLPTAVESIRYVFRSNSGFSCCVVIDPDDLNGNNAVTLQSLPEGAGTIQVSGYPTTFAGAPEGVTEICPIDPNIGRACSRNRLSSPSFDSGPRDVVIVGGDATDAGDVQVRSVPFVLIPSLLPVPNSAVNNPIEIQFTVVDAIFGVDPDSIDAALLPIGGSRRTLNVVLRACTDGTAAPCSPNGQLGVSGFIGNADNPQVIPAGDAGIEINARNEAPTPGSMQFSYNFSAGVGGATSTPQRTPTATVGVPTQPTTNVATRTPTPSRTVTRAATFTPSVTRTPKEVSLAFIRAASFDVSHEPSFVAVGDFNRDGRDDVAVTSPESKEVNVLLGNFDGTFTPGTVARFGTFPGTIVAGNINGDVFVDLAVVDERAGGVFLLYGAANGTFTAPTLRLIGRRPYGVTIADYDGQTGNDLAVTDRDANRVLILLNDGQPTPTFRNGGNAAVGAEPTEIVTGDFNNDGKPDLATLNSGGSAVKDVTLLLFSRVEGGLVIFNRAANLVVGDRPLDLSIAELNSDSSTDLIMLNRPVDDGFGEVDYLLSRPGGLLTQHDPLIVHCPDRTVNCRARALAVGDFDNDGTSDITLTLNQTGQGLDSDVLTVLLGTGDGGFIPGPTLPASGQPLAMGTGDFTGDGREDIIVTSAQADSVQVYVNVGNQP